MFEGGLDLVSDAFSLVVCTFEPIWIQSSSAGVCVNVVEIVRHVCLWLCGVGRSCFGVSAGSVDLCGVARRVN